MTVQKEATGLKVRTQKFDIRTERGPQFVDITDHVVSAIERAGVTNGFAVIFARHTTAAIRINEAEPHLIRDMERMLESIAPSCHDYAHNEYAHSLDNGERPNGHSHCQHLLLGASEAIPVVNGELVFGPWQRVFLVELDHGRDREVVVQLVGE